MTPGTIPGALDLDEILSRNKHHYKGLFAGFRDINAVTAELAVPYTDNAQECYEAVTQYAPGISESVYGERDTDMGEVAVRALLFGMSLRGELTGSLRASLVNPLPFSYFGKGEPLRGVQLIDQTNQYFSNRPNLREFIDEFIPGIVESVSDEPATTPALVVARCAVGLALWESEEQSYQWYVQREIADAEQADLDFEAEYTDKFYTE